MFKQSIRRRRQMIVERLEPRKLMVGSFGNYLHGIEYYTDSNLTTPGLVGSYIDQALEEAIASDDWRASQSVTGSRVSLCSTTV